VFRRDPRECASKKRTIVIVRLGKRFGREAFEIVKRVAKIGRDRGYSALLRKRVAVKNVDAFARPARRATSAARTLDERMFRQRSHESIARKRRPVFEAARP